jgi:protein proQ homolog
MTETQINETQIDVKFEEAPKLSSNKEIIAYLAEKFPLCFVLDGEAKPIKIGLFQDLAEALQDDPRVSKTQLRHALRQYTSNWRYLHGCREGAVRVDLYGNPAGVLEQQHVEHAVQQLAEAKAKFAEKKAAERAATKTNKKRPARKPADKKVNAKTAKKPTVLRKEGQGAKPKVEFREVDFASLEKGSKVKVKVGDNAKNAVVLELIKDSARVQLENGLVMNVTTERLFA